MAQQADFTVYDGAATPVNRSLKGEGIKTLKGEEIVASWKTTDSALPDDAQLRLSLRHQRLRSGVTRSTARVELSVMEIVSGVNAQGYQAPSKIAYRDRAEFVFTAHPRSSETTKRVTSQILLNWCNNTVTNPTPVSSGVVMDLCQRLLMVS